MTGVILVDVGWCLEHEQPTVHGADHCPLVYWLEARHTVQQAAEAAAFCRVIAAQLQLPSG